MPSFTMRRDLIIVPATLLFILTTAEKLGMDEHLENPLTVYIFTLQRPPYLLSSDVTLRCHFIISIIITVFLLLKKIYKNVDSCVKRYWVLIDMPGPVSFMDST